MIAIKIDNDVPTFSIKDVIEIYTNCLGADPCPPSIRGCKEHIDCKECWRLYLEDKVLEKL